MDRPSVRELECFVVVAEGLHFSKAAKRLHMSQPPLTRQIQSLERKLGVQLLKRKTRSVELTSPGRNFLNDAREILHQLDRSVITVQRMQQGEHERLRLGFIGYLLAPDLVEVLRAFRKIRPQCQVELLDMEPGDQLTDIREGKLDGGFFGIGPTEPLWDLKLFSWKTVPLVIVLPEDHRLIQKTCKLALANLKEENWIMISRSRAPAFRGLVDDLCLGAGFLPRIVQESDSVQAVMAMVAAGTGIAIASETVTQMIGCGLAYRTLASRNAVLRRNFVWRNADSSEALRAFNNVLRRYRAETAMEPGEQGVSPAAVGPSR
jgi:DNA-binding transcriptional LysR family regulator